MSAGVAAAALHGAMLAIERVFVVNPSRLPLVVFVPLVLAGMAAAAWLTGWLMKRYAPDAPGSGIPQVKAAYRRGELHFTWKLVAVKFFGGAASIGTGSSLGREGPTIHIGAAVASKVAGWLGETPSGRAKAVCAGSAAGLAAAFGSPIAGVTLVLEEIAGGKNQARLAGHALLAAALAVVTIRLISGGGLSLPIGAPIALSWRALWLAPLVALVAGGVGLAFQRLTLALRAHCRNASGPARLVGWTLAAGGFAAIAFAATGHLGAFGLGEADLLASLRNELAWPAALCLLVAKFAATAACYGAGGCGGIFAPIIFFGSMAGVIVHAGAAPFLFLTGEDQTVLALTGMTACLGGVVRAPLTSILIVVEMTGQLNVLPALMVAAVISVFLNNLVFQGNFYDEVLRQDGVSLR